MRKTLALVLILGAAATAERTIGEFRLKKDPTAPMRGWIVDYDDQRFVFERFGGRGKLTIPWDDLVEDDARKLRLRFRLELSEDERLGLIDGHEIFFKGGGSVVGLLERVEQGGGGRHWMRVEGLLLPYPADRIDRVEKCKVREADVYSDDEVYARRMERQPPEDAKDHRRFGDYLYDIGNWEGAGKQYRAAIAKDPSMRTEIEGRLAEIKDYMEDQAAAAVFRKALKLANLDGKYAEAAELVNEYIRQYPGARRRGIRILDLIEERQVAKKRALFHRVKNEELDRSIRRYLFKLKPGLDEARSWVTAQLEDEVEQRVKERLELTADEWETFRETKPKGAPHWASYWSGSFVVNRRVKKGRSSARVVRGDPDSWWARYNDVNTRANWLKAYAAERLKLFEIVMVRNTPCDRCGGTGSVRKMSLKALPDGRHEWMETCPRCYGAREDRAVGYR
jgi:tetratricopeptide (TPR) repeat protein